MTKGGQILALFLGTAVTAGVIYAIRLEEEGFMKGGKADDMKPGDFDPGDLKEGTVEEMEHTQDARIAQQIAMDHLAEDPDYYRKLSKAGL